MSTAYFKTLAEAEQALQPYAGQSFPNKYQFPGESDKAQVREFERGFAIQFGDCGPYLQKEDL